MPSNKYDKLYIFENFLRFLSLTDEREKILKKIISKITKLEKRWAFLDIGAGTGQIAFRMLDLFKYITIIEPSVKLIKIIRQESKKRTNRIKIISKRIEHAKLSKKFNTILVSHIFGSIDISEWDSILERVWSCLDKNGYLFIVCNHPESELMSFLETFWGRIHKKPQPSRYVLVDKIYRITKIRPKTKKIKCKLFIPNIRDALTISQFLLESPLSKMTQKFKKDLINYFRRFFDSRKRCITIDSSNWIIWLKKEI